MFIVNLQFPPDPGHPPALARPVTDQLPHTKWYNEWTYCRNHEAAEQAQFALSELKL